VSDYDVIVIGGGVIGLAAGWRLAQRDMRVVVLDRGEPGGGTSHVAAGMLAPVAEAHAGEEPLLRLGIASAQAFPAFVAELEDLTGLDAGYLRCGTLIAARDRDEAEALEHELQIRQQFGLRVRRVAPSEARALEPALAPTIRGAVDVPDDHVIDPRKLSAALAEAVRASGGELAGHSEAVSLELDGGGAGGVRLVGGTRLTASRVLIAAGVWSAAIEGIPEEARVPIRPVKGQILRMHDPAGEGLLTRVLRMPSAYVAPRGDGRYVLGATMEERGLDTTVTAGAMFELLRDATELLPGLSEAVIDELSAGLRPASPDNAPAIGPGAIPRLYWATGHYRNGILLGPITAQLIADAIAGDPVPDEFSPLRYAGIEAAVR
jgi:glycine oxidase